MPVFRAGKINGSTVLYGNGWMYTCNQLVYMNIKSKIYIFIQRDLSGMGAPAEG